MPTVRSAHARVAAVKKHHPNSTEAVADAVRDLKAASAEAYVKQIVDQAPALSRAQLDALASLLRGGL